MLNVMRKYARGWVAGALIGLLAIAFAIWGINDVFSPTPKNAAITGQGVEISLAEFDTRFEQVMRNQNAQMQAQGQPSASKSEFLEAGIHEQLAQQLMREAAMTQLSQRMGLTVPPARIVASLQEEPAFRSQATNRFDAEVYRRALAMAGLTPNMFEAQERAKLERSLLRNSAVFGLEAPQSIANVQLMYLLEKRKLSVAEVSMAQVGPVPTPTEEQLKQRYEQMKSNFSFPETRKVTLIHAAVGDFEAKVVSPEAELRQLFEVRKAKATTPEQRSFVQVTAPSQAAAADAAKRLAAGEDPAAVAKAVGGNINSFDKQARAQVPNEALATAIFALNAGQTTGAIQGQLGWSAAKLLSITPGAEPSFEQMRADLQKEIAGEQGRALAEDAIKKFDDAIAGGADLLQAARDVGFRVIEIPAVAANGLDRQGQPAPGLALADNLDRDIFASPVGELSDFVSAADGGSVRYRVETVIPAGAEPFESVKPAVEQAWRLGQARDMLRAFAEKVVAEIKAGKSFDKAVADHKLKPIAKSEEINRGSLASQETAQFNSDVFRANTGDVVMAEIAGNPLVWIGKVEAIERPNLKDPTTLPAGFAQQRQQLMQPMMQSVVETLTQAAVAGAKLKVEQTALNQHLGIGQGDGQAGAGRP